MIRSAKQAAGRLTSFLASVHRSVLDASIALGRVICAFKGAVNLNSMKTGFVTCSKGYSSSTPSGVRITNQATQRVQAFA